MPSLSSEAMRRLVAEARLARLATVDAAGRPHLVPVCFALEPGAAQADRVHIAVDFKPKTTTELRRTANLRATGRASLLVDHYDEDWSQLWWVRLDGTGQPLDDPAEAIALAARRAGGEVPAVPRPASGRTGAADRGRVLPRLERHPARLIGYSLCAPVRVGSVSPIQTALTLQNSRMPSAASSRP